jgi:hypothetical protein
MRPYPPDCSPHAHLREPHLEGRRVRRGEHIGLFAGSGDVTRPELDLERRHPVRCPGGRADLGRVVGKRREVAAGRRSHLCELQVGEPHAVAQVPSEPDQDGVPHSALGAGGNGERHGSVGLSVLGFEV